MQNGKLKVSRKGPARTAAGGAGFGLIELLVALAIVGLLWGGFKYFKQYEAETRSAISGAESAKQQAEQARALIEARYK